MPQVTGNVFNKCVSRQQVFLNFTLNKLFVWTLAWSYNNQIAPVQFFAFSFVARVAWLIGRTFMNGLDIVNEPWAGNRILD